MRTLGHCAFFLSCVFLLAACAASETRSVVSKDDLPASKYQKLAIFIENLNDAERPAAEQIIVSTLRNSNVNAVSGTNVFKGRGATLTEKAKAAIVQKEFDAVMYVSVIEKNVFEEPVPNAYYDGQMVQFNVLGIVSVGTNVIDLYVIHPDGSVFQSMYGLKTHVDIQDTKSAKSVWASETVSTGNTKTTNMNALFANAAQQIVSKMREDNTI